VSRSTWCETKSEKLHEHREFRCVKIDRAVSLSRSLTDKRISMKAFVANLTIVNEEEQSQ